MIDAEALSNSGGGNHGVKQGIRAQRYQVVPRTLCFITHGEEILLLRGAADKPLWPGQYNGIGGHVEPSEDVYAAARREIEEETGLEVQGLCLRGVINIPVGQLRNRGVLLFVFTAAASGRDVRPSEEGAPEWIARERLSELDLVEDLSILIPRVMGMRTGEDPFFAHYSYDEQERLVVTFSSRSSSRKDRAQEV